MVRNMPSFDFSFFGLLLKWNKAIFNLEKLKRSFVGNRIEGHIFYVFSICFPIFFYLP